MKSLIARTSLVPVFCSAQWDCTSGTLPHSLFCFARAEEFCADDTPVSGLLEKGLRLASRWHAHRISPSSKCILHSSCLLLLLLIIINIAVLEQGFNFRCCPSKAASVQLKKCTEEENKQTYNTWASYSNLSCCQTFSTLHGSQ